MITFGIILAVLSIFLIIFGISRMNRPVCACCSYEARNDAFLNGRKISPGICGRCVEKQKVKFRKEMKSLQPKILK